MTGGLRSARAPCWGAYSKSLTASRSSRNSAILASIFSRLKSLTSTPSTILVAMDHIRTYGSNHTDAIMAEDDAIAETFFTGLDSAILMRNASTQFADGGEFGMGAEIGIATGKLHARGPVGAVQLTSFKYLVTGDGTVRP